MPEIRSMARGGAVAALALAIPALTASGGIAGQLHSTLAVTVEVVDACHAATGPQGLEAQACDSRAAPVAVIREPAGAAAADGPTGGSAPRLRLSGPDGYVTIVY